MFLVALQLWVTFEKYAHFISLSGSLKISLDVAFYYS